MRRHWPERRAPSWLVFTQNFKIVGRRLAILFLKSTQKMNVKKLRAYFPKKKSRSFLSFIF